MPTFKKISSNLVGDILITFLLRLCHTRSFIVIISFCLTNHAHGFIFKISMNLLKFVSVSKQFHVENEL